MRHLGWLLLLITVAICFYHAEYSRQVLLGTQEILIDENKTYRKDLDRQHINLKECMSVIPKLEVQKFYKRHREEYFKNE